MNQHEIKKVLEVGILLSAERDLPRLLEQILTCVMDLARCDAGTLYLRDGDALRFKIMRNNSMHTYSGGDGRDPDLPPVPLCRENVCALSLLDNRTICIDDVYHCQEHDFSGPKRYDARTGYRTQSMLVVPMRNREGEILGVIQLLNALDGAGNVCPFSEDMALVLESVASQAAITVQNVRYIREIKGLFQSFVNVMSAAIDERTPYNASHSRRMANCGGRLWDFLAAQTGNTARFSPARKEELRTSILLHDIGKLTTPLDVMNKAERLLPAQKTAFFHRMEVIRLQGQIDHLSGRLDAEELEALCAATREAEALVSKLCLGAPLSDEQRAALEALAERSCTGPDGEEHPWLEPEEKEMLSIPRGTLSAEERKIMEEHVIVTDKLLSRIHFSKDLSHVREWAAGHHELLNGTGYPNHLAGDQIPIEVRIITILDIFDAMVADDRPYKPGMPVERALSILRSDADAGRLDPELTGLFIQSKCWEEFYGKKDTKHETN